MYNLAAITLGVLINYLFGGIEFTPILCLFATFFIMVPALLDFDLHDLKLLKKHKKETIYNVLLNFVVFPLVSITVGYLIFENNPVTYALGLMSVISGGGLLMSWLNKTKSDKKFGFNIFVLNMLIFTVLFFPIDYFLKKAGLDFMANPTDFSCDSSQLISQVSCSTSPEGGVSPFSGLVILIIIPFIITRFIRFFPDFFDQIEKNKTRLSQLGTFLIISYIFALKPLHVVGSMDKSFLAKIFFTVLLTYFIVFSINFLIYKKSGEKPLHRSLFWVGITRFLTLGLIFSFLYAQYFGPSFMLVFAIAYLIQIGGSTVIAKYIFHK